MANIPASPKMRNVCNNLYHKFVFSPEYMWCSKVKILCLSVINETSWWPVSVYLSLPVISDYTITVSTPDFGEASELNHLPLVPHICASVLDPGNGSALVQVMVYTGSGYSLWQFMTRLVINKVQTVWHLTLPLGINSWKCMRIGLLWNSGHFVRRGGGGGGGGGLGLSHIPSRVIC